ncbi:MAG: recombinase family protein [Lactobacillales bacterium]|nr:recombinase family protein [Lactobacillales bacterium]
MKAVILARVSSKEQEEGYSLSAQITRLAEYATRKQLDVLEIFQLTESSTQGDRKKFNEILKFCERQKEPVALIADAVDRVQRSFKESIKLNELCKSGKIELHFFREGMIINQTASSMDIMRWDFAVMSAKSYVLQLAENVKRSVDYKIKSGEWSGRAPIGYRNYRDSNNKSQIVIDEKTGPKIKKLFEIYSLGACSFKELAKEAEKMGLKSAKGNPLTYTFLHGTFQNPFYYGVMRVKGQLWPHKYEQLITKDLWEKCEAIRLGTNKKPYKYSEKPFVYRGLIKCANSGVICSTDQKKGQFNYIVCYDKDKKRKYIKEEAIDGQIVRILDSIKIPENVLDEITEYMKSSKSAEKNFRDQSLRDLNVELGLIQRRLDSLIEMYLDRKISEDIYNLKLPELQTKKSGLENHIAAHRKADDQYNEQLVSTMRIVRGAADFFVSTQDFKEKRLLVKTLLRTLMIDNGNVSYSLRSPFDVFQKIASGSVWRTRQDSNLQPSDP